MFHIIPPGPLQARSCLQCLSPSLNSSSSTSVRAVGRLRITSRRLIAISTAPHQPHHQRRHASSSSSSSVRSGDFERRYFVYNSLWKRDVNAATTLGGRAMAHQTITIPSSSISTSTVVSSSSTSTTTSDPPTATATATADLSSILPHRRKKYLKELEKQQQNQQNPPPPPPATEQEEQPLPLDASSRLTNAVTKDPNTSSLRRTLAAYLALSKPRLAALVVLTAMASYALYPTPEHLIPLPSSTTLSALTLLHLSVGTYLCIASANALNMIFEIPRDAKMSRTRNRPLVRGLLSWKQALIFAVICGISGVVLLTDGVNPTVAMLGAGNIWLYSFVYTPMKVVSVGNTWVGALVGAIPPLMGWAAAAGEGSESLGSRVSEANADVGFGESTTTTTTTTTGGKRAGAGAAVGDDILGLITEQLKVSYEVLTEHPGGLLLAAMLFAWQFPHFMAFSHMVRAEYATAGYRMLAISNPARNARVALRYSLSFFPICVGLWYTGVTDPVFVFDSGIANGWLVWESIKFWKEKGEKGTARRLFWVSVWHLPVLLVLAMAHKRGLWRGVWEGIMGREEGDEEEWEDDE